MASKKKKKDPQPKVPDYQNIDTASLKQPSQADRPEYEPMSLNDFSNWMNKAYQIQLQYAPSVAEAQRQAQSTLFNNMAGLQQQQAGSYADVANKLLKGYDPQFRRTYAALGNRINQGLASGYELGDDLSREVEQGIRSGQMARGNWLGPAPTAQEAMGRGQAALQMYNTRLGQAQNYLQGRNPLDVMGQAAGTFMGQSYYPQQSYVNTDLGAQAMGQAGSQGQQFNATVMQGYGTYQGALQDYNKNYIGATSANNEAMFGQYDRTADAWMYREAVRNGLYSTPSAGGGGMMGGMGSAMGGISSGLMGLAGAGISAGVLTGGGAAAAGIGAAASAAAAAICWLARKVLPDRWKAFRKYLFTEASPELRRQYIFNARRIANALP